MVSLKSWKEELTPQDCSRRWSETYAYYFMSGFEDYDHRGTISISEFATSPLVQVPAVLYTGSVFLLVGQYDQVRLYAPGMTCRARSLNRLLRHHTKYHHV